MDGADEVDPELRLIKGGGGALLREKIVASATRQLIIVADASKQVPVLGNFPLPVEVIRFAQTLVAKRIGTLGADVQLRRGVDGKPYLTDENNHILDCRFGTIPDADGLARQLSEMPGVVEHGLFIGMATVVLLAKGRKGFEGAADPLFEHVIQATRRRGFASVFAAYRGDWPVQLSFFQGHGFRPAREMVNFVADPEAAFRKR